MSNRFEPFAVKAYAELDQLDEAYRCIREAMATIETSKEKWCQAEVNRVAGELALSREPNAASAAEAYFERALPPRGFPKPIPGKMEWWPRQAPAARKSWLFRSPTPMLGVTARASIGR